MDKKNHLVQVTTKELEDELPKNIFLRIHKSFIVNRSRISRITDEEVFLGETKLPIGKTFKKYVKETIGKIAGDAKLQSDGRADRAEGAIQDAVGGARDAVRDVLKK